MIAEGTQIYLEKLTLDHLDSFHEYRRNPEVCKYQGYSPFTKQEASDFITGNLPIPIGSRGKWTQIGIYSSINNQLIGDCVSNFQQDEPRNVELGISINPAFQNQGLATDTTTTLMEYLKSNFDVHKFIARVDARNQSCIRVFEKLAFQLEGTIREDFYDKEDKIWIDLLMFGKIV